MSMTSVMRAIDCSHLRSIHLKGIEIILREFKTEFGDQVKEKCQSLRELIIEDCFSHHLLWELYAQKSSNFKSIHLRNCRQFKPEYADLLVKMLEKKPLKTLTLQASLNCY